MLSISEDGFGLYICSKVTGKCDAAFLHPSQMDSMNIDQLLVQIRAILKVEFVLRFAVSYLEVKFIQLPQFLGLIHLMHKSKMNVHSVIDYRELNGFIAIVDVCTNKLREYFQ